MRSAFQVPAEWWDYHNNPGYFFTYYGDVYYGRLFEHDESGSVFVVQNNKTMQLREKLSSGSVSLEEMQKIGWRIPSPKMIKKVLPANGKLGQTESDFGLIQNVPLSPQKLFIFGAGASANCVYGEKKKAFEQFDFRPPLGTEMLSDRFDETIRLFDGARHFVSVAEANINGIESCFEEEWQNIISNYNPKLVSTQIALQYCIKHLFWKISNFTFSRFDRGSLYSLFADKIQKHLARNPDEHLNIISFNYDTILDQFLEARFDPFLNMDDYVNPSERQLSLFKPHGSCNWGWKIQDPEIGNWDIAELSNEIHKRKFDYHDLYYSLLGQPEEMIHHGSWGYEASLHENGLGRFSINKSKIEIIPQKPNHHYYPALLLPYRDKDEFVFPYRHFYFMKNAVDRVEDLTIIGWKGSEATFNNILKKDAGRLKRIMIADPDFKNVAKTLHQVVDPKKVRIEGCNGFEDFVLNHLDSRLNEN